MKLNRSLLATPNFVKLVQIVGDRQKALGMLAEVHILARFYYLPHRQPIPQAELMEAELPIEKLIKLKFLEKEIEGYYMTGSDLAFEDYFSGRAQRSQAGRASAKSPNHHALRDEFGRFVSKAKLAEMSQAEIDELKAMNAKKRQLPKNGKKSRKTSKKTAKKSKSSRKTAKKVKKSENFMEGRKEYIAYISRDGVNRTPFTRHFSVDAAERKYGDLSKYYKGSSQSDMELIVLERSEIEAMAKKGECSIFWQERVILWDPE